MSNKIQFDGNSIHQISRKVPKTNEYHIEKKETTYEPIKLPPFKDHKEKITLPYIWKSADLERIAPPEHYIK